MASRIAAPRGTRDVLPEETALWNRVEAVARDLSSRYAFERIETPIFERVELFARGLGESSDAVEKEMFRVSGAAGSGEQRAEWALRPEPTAGIVRAYVQHGLQVRPGPLRFWMLGRMYRYDRPQAGRYREFTQWDVEVLGDPGPMVDAEIIELASRFYSEVGIPGVVTHLNSIGDAVCRPAFRQALIDYFEPLQQRLGEDSRRRLRVNPLRVLDDKELDPELAAGAPRSLDHLCDPCAEHFAAVRSLLDELRLPYVIDHREVRGLDYYTRTTFEWFVAGREGQQQALGGGGRYDGLVEHLGGQATPGIGFGIGVDRTVLAAAELEARPSSEGQLVAVVAGSDDLGERLAAATRLRQAGLRVRVDGSLRRLGRQLESAAKAGAATAVILGVAPAGQVVVRDLGSGEQREVPLEQVAAVIGA